MSELVKAVIEWLKDKLTTTLVAFFAIASGFFIFVPNSVLIPFGLVDLRGTYRPWISIVFIFAALWLLFIFAQWAIKAIVNSRKQNLENQRQSISSQEQIIVFLQNMHWAEKQYLIAFYTNRDIAEVKVADVETAAFVNAGILTIIGEPKYKRNCGMDAYATYRINPFAKKYILENPKLLEQTPLWQIQAAHEDQKRMKRSNQ